MNFHDWLHQKLRTGELEDGTVTTAKELTEAYKDETDQWTNTHQVAKLLHHAEYGIDETVQYDVETYEEFPHGANTYKVTA